MEGGCETTTLDPSVCLHVGYSRRLRDDKHPHPGTNNAHKTIVKGQKWKSIFLDQRI